MTALVREPSEEMKALFREPSDIRKYHPSAHLTCLPMSYLHNMYDLRPGPLAYTHRSVFKLLAGSIDSL